MLSFWGRDEVDGQQIKVSEPSTGVEGWVQVSEHCPGAAAGQWGRERQSQSSLGPVHKDLG